MLQDLFPHVYHNEISWNEPKKTDVALVFSKEHTLYCNLSEDEITLPTMGEVSQTAVQYAFSIDETAYYLVQAAPVFNEKYSFVETRKLRSVTDSTSCSLFAAAAGESLYRWYESQKFCGCCGSRMEHSKTERAMVCPNCKHTVYPKICPAVIVAVCRDDQILLTKYAGRPFKKYALIAGFNEIGESIEQTVHREVMEEVGLKVKNLRFYKSQPWVFTDTLLMGFYCEVDGTDEVTLQTDELAEGTWFHRADIPEDHSHISLTGEMIEQFRHGSKSSFSSFLFTGNDVK